MADSRKRRVKALGEIDPVPGDRPVEELRRLVSRLNAGAALATDLKVAKPREGPSAEADAWEPSEKTFRVLRAGGDAGPG